MTIRGKRRKALGEITVPDEHEIYIKRYNAACKKRLRQNQTAFAVTDAQYNAIGQKMGHDRMLLLLEKRRQLQAK